MLTRYLGVCIIDIKYFKSYYDMKIQVMLVQRCRDGESLLKYILVENISSSLKEDISLYVKADTHRYRVKYRSF